MRYGTRFTLTKPDAVPRRPISGLLGRESGVKSKMDSILQLRHAGRTMTDVTQLLHATTQGDPRAAAELLPLVYDELRRLASHRLAGERNNHTLQPTALVHEAWLKISSDQGRDWNGRQHFFAAAAEAMRRILLDRARRRLAAKRGAGEVCLDADDLDIPAPAADDQLLAVNEALEKFVVLDARKAELVKLRYFVGMNFEEAAAAMGIAVPTAKQWWAYARAWLRVEMAGESKTPSTNIHEPEKFQ